MNLQKYKTIHYPITYLGIVTLLLLFTGYACTGARDGQVTDTVFLPEIDGEWWQVAGNPDLGHLNTLEQQPVDFGIWQAADGSWQIWSCIRKTREDGNTRLFYRWESENLEDRNWKPMGIAMRADTTLGESPGGLQAPYVIKQNDRYLMFYGDWNNICLAESKDGKTFTRVVRDGSPRLFGDKKETNTRDPMLIYSDDLWYCYYTAHPDNDGAIYVRTSSDFFNWSESQRVCYGGSPGKGALWYAECPHVVEYTEGNFYLFRTYSYGNFQSGELLSTPKTNIYHSRDPSDFGIDTDQHLIHTLEIAAPEIIHKGDKWYVAALNEDLQGIRIARLKWIMQDD